MCELLCQSSVHGKYVTMLPPCYAASYKRLFHIIAILLSINYKHTQVIRNIVGPVVEEMPCSIRTLLYSVPSISKTREGATNQILWGPDVLENEWPVIGVTLFIFHSFQCLPKAWSQILLSWSFELTRQPSKALSLDI